MTPKGFEPLFTPSGAIKNEGSEQTWRSCIASSSSESDSDRLSRAWSRRIKAHRQDVEVDPQPAAVCIHRDPLDASSHGRLALGKRPLPKGGAEARGEPRRLAHGLGHLGLGERLVLQGLKFGLQVLALFVELGQAPIDELRFGQTGAGLIPKRDRGQAMGIARQVG